MSKREIFHIYLCSQSYKVYGIFAFLFGGEMSGRWGLGLVGGDLISKQNVRITWNMVKLATLVCSLLN